MIEIGNAKIYTGDVTECLKLMPDKSVHMVCCSPPYWGLRDYKCGEWEGGNPDCDHEQGRFASGNVSDKQSSNSGSGTQGGKNVCPKCGAVYNQNNMIGLEPTFQQWLDKMVAVSAELWRVLRDDGTYWLNCGDAYSSSPPGNKSGKMKDSDGVYERRFDRQLGHGEDRADIWKKDNRFKTKDLMMMPARLAIALQDAGWYVRSEIIWAKPNPMPESVRDRPTSSHEKIYLLTKKPRYFYDADAVREKHMQSSIDRVESSPHTGSGMSFESRGKENAQLPEVSLNPSGRNQRNVWNIATKPYPDAHFATFPPEIPRRCIMAGTSERGCCPECGNQWERVVETERIKHSNTPGSGGRQTCEDGGKVSGSSCFRTGLVPINKTIGWKPTCECKKHPAGSSGTGTNIPGHKGNLKADGTPISPERKTIGWESGCDCGHDPVPSTVLDIFGGAMTTGLVALELNRKFIGIELNQDYVKLGIERIKAEANQLKMF